MKDFKYLIVGYASLNGQKLNAKICFDDSDFDYWMGSFGIEGDKYARYKSLLDRHGFIEFEPSKTGFNNSWIKIFTAKDLMRRSESHKY